MLNKTNKNLQKGVSLIITFFIMTIMLAIILSISIILFSELKILRNIGNSVVAFYAADSGVEKTLYFDRQQRPENAKRGICNICNVCSDDPGLDNSCAQCSLNPLSETGCNPETCQNCQISFETTIGDKRYELKAEVTPSGQFSNLEISSFGFFKDVTRAIELQIKKKEAGVSAPNIINAFVDHRSVERGDVIYIFADILDVDGVNPETVFAHIQKPDETDFVDPLLLTTSDGMIYTGSWQATETGFYYVDINACDIGGNCGEAENI